MAKQNLFRDLKLISRDEANRIAEELQQEGHDYEIFTSAETQEYANALVASLTGRYGDNRISTRISYDPYNDDIGWKCRCEQRAA